MTRLDKTLTAICVVFAIGVAAAPSDATRAVGPPVNKTLPHIRLCHINSHGRNVCRRIA